MNKILYCQKCKTYTLNEICSICGNPTILRAPPRYSQKEQIAKYRRKMKKDILKRKGLI